MKTTLKILGLVFIITFTMLSCDQGCKPENPDNLGGLDNINPPLRPEDFYKLHHHIRPTKPIRIPDTMTIVQPNIFKLPTDSIPQDSTHQKNEEFLR